jgi:hypothetical protein
MSIYSIVHCVIKSLDQNNKQFVFHYRQEGNLSLNVIVTNSFDTSNVASSLSTTTKTLTLQNILWIIN